MYVMREHFYSASVLNMKTKLLPQYSSLLQNSPLSLFGKELRSSYPKENIPSPLPPPPPKKRKLTCPITKKEMQCSVSRLLSFSSGRIPRILRAFHYTRATWEVAKIPNSNSSFFIFSFPTNVKLYAFHSDTLFLFLTSMTWRYFSFRYFVLVSYVNDLALLNHSINRPLCPKFLNLLS